MNKRWLFGIAVVGLTLVGGLVWANPACIVDNCREQGGSRWSVGGSIDVISGGDLDIESGATFKVGGVAVTPTVETVAATNVITAIESGATFFLNNSTEFVSTLPTVEAGLRYRFIVTAAPSGANYTIVTPSGLDLMAVILTAGGIDDASDVAVDRDVITFVSAQAVVGDWVECISDGTKWFCRGSAAVAAGITTGQS